MADILSYAHADDLFFAANDKINEGKYAEAKDLLLQAIQLEPKHGRAHNHLGWILERKYRDFIESEKQYKLALEYAPEYVPVYANYSVLLSIMEKYDELEKLVKKALAVEGTDKVTLYSEYAYALERQGKYTEAIANYQNMLRQAYDKGDVDRAVAAIERCKQKEGLLGKIA
jgi:tetratricopeptide (TPR) repeat protein